MITGEFGRSTTSRGIRKLPDSASSSKCIIAEDDYSSKTCAKGVLKLWRASEKIIVVLAIL
jgi:hypothetical protein